MKKSRVTKKATNELINLIESKGYWSEDVKIYLSQYEYSAMVRLNNEAKRVLRFEK